MKKMKRWLSFLLVTVLLISTCTGVFPIHAADSGTEVRWGQIGGGSAIAILNGNAAGVRFAAENSFIAVTFAANCKVEYTVRVFEWYADYANTTAGEPVAAVKHTVTKAGLQTVNLGAILPAGEYYVEYTAEGAYDSTDQTGRADLWTNTPDSKVECYYNGAVTTAANQTVAGGIVYVDNTVTTLGTISHPYTALWGQIGGGSAIAILNGNAAGVRFAAENSFKAVTFAVNCKVEYTVRVFEWYADYATTTAGEPVAAVKHTVTKAGAQTVNLGAILPAGEYYVEYTAEGAYDSTDQTGRADLWTNTPDSRVECYYNGAVTTAANQTVAGGIVYVDNTVTALGGISKATRVFWSNTNEGNATFLCGGTMASGVQATAGVRFAATDAFAAVVFGTTKLVDYTVNVYEWKIDYATTTSRSPVVTKVQTGVAGWNSVAFDQPLPAGEYYVEYSADVDGAHVWAYTSEGKVEYYHNGAKTTDKAKTAGGGIVYVYNDNASFGAMSANSVALWGQIGGTGAGNLWLGGTEGAALDPGERAVAGVRFAATNAFMAVKFGTGDTKEYTVKVWAWENDYASTTAQSPVFETVHTAVPGGNTVLLDEPLPQGEYYVEFSADADYSYIWSFAASEQAEYYYNGTFTTETDRTIGGGIVYVDDTSSVLGDPVDITYRAVQPSLALYNETEETFDIRFIATVDSLDFHKVGFVVTATTADNQQRQWTSDSKTVYTGLNATAYREDGSAENKVITTTDLGGGQYIVAVTIKNVPKNQAIDFSVCPYVIHSDAATLHYGEEWNVHVTAEGVMTNEKVQ